MASAEKAVYGILKAASGVTSLVSTRVHGGKVPQDAPRSGADLLAYLRYYREGTEYPDRRMKGGKAHRSALIMVEVWARDYDDCKALADAVEAALENYDGSIAGVTVRDIDQIDRSDVPVIDEGFLEQQLYRVTV